LGAAGLSTGASGLAGLSSFGLGAATNQKYGEPQVPSGALAGGAGTGADIVYNKVYDLDYVEDLGRDCTRLEIPDSLFPFNCSR
jgi:hypothetical protein